MTTLKINFALIFSHVLLLCYSFNVRAASPDDTMLMFVGETQPVVTVASRYPESPATAPAMVSVISAEEIELYGYQTLGDLLAFEPGFYIAPGGRGSVAYLRGLRDAVLFLYDGVPITTDVTKSFAPLGREISLAALERVEIVRGPGSVLWGPDAYAGVVNLIPKRSHQKVPSTLSLAAGTSAYKAGTLDTGLVNGKSDLHLTLAGNAERYANDDFSVARTDGEKGSEKVGLSKNLELVGTYNYGDWIHLSGRWSDDTHNYTMQNGERDIRWAGTKEAPFRYIKLSVNQNFGASHYQLSGFYAQTDYLVRDGSTERSQQNQMTQFELLWDRRILGRGLLSAGTIWRQSAVDGAVVRDGFAPDFIGSDIDFFIPEISQRDFSSRLMSFFSQLRYRWGKGEWWLGGRYDDHSQYQTTLSYSLGFHRPLNEALFLKANYGTAFRSPYSSQLYATQHFEPEAVSTASAQLSWQPQENFKMGLTLFYSRYKNHRAEDPYGGLSVPREGKNYGFELSGHMLMTRRLAMDLGFSYTQGTSETETFQSLLYAFLRPDGTQVPVYENWHEPVDQGPQWQAQWRINWQPFARQNLTLAIRTSGRMDYSYEKSEFSGSYHAPLLVDLGYRLSGLTGSHDSFSLQITNLLDQRYNQADLYGPTQGAPLQVVLGYSYSF